MRPSDHSGLRREQRLAHPNAGDVGAGSHPRWRRPHDLQGPRARPGVQSWRPRRAESVTVTLLVLLVVLALSLAGTLFATSRLRRHPCGPQTTTTAMTSTPTTTPTATLTAGIAAAGNAATPTSTSPTGDTSGSSSNGCGPSSAQGQRPVPGRRQSGGTPSGGALSGTPAPGLTATTTPRSQPVPGADAHTPAGAVKTATSVLTALTQVMTADPETRRQAITAMASPRSAAALERQYDWVSAQAAQLLQTGQAGTQIVVRFLPVGWHVDAYDDRRAVVSVLGTGLLGSTAGVPLREQWTVTQVTLLWQGSGWRLLSSSDKPAIVPLSDPQSQTADDGPAPVAAVQAFKEYHYVP